MNTLQRNLDLLLDSVINAQKRGVAISGNLPSHLDGSINKECFCFPKRYGSTFPFEKGLSTLITKIMRVTNVPKEWYFWLRNSTATFKRR
jgi:hypothetical protein